MAWEPRGNNIYYYRKKRIDGKVISEYVGKGVRAQKIASMYLAVKEKKKKEDDNIRQQKKQFYLLNNQIIQMSLLSDQMVGYFLTTAGFHKHKGQWRRRRDVNKRR